MATKFTYVIEYVANMDQAVHFYRDALGLQLKFQSAEWSEFGTGGTHLALHLASEKNPPGKIELGICVNDLHGFYADLLSKGIRFTRPPSVEEGELLAVFLGPDGLEYRVRQAP